MKKPGIPLKRATLDERYDVIVIGSGIGGLTAARLLQHYGHRKVLVLEKHYVAGGFCHSFQRPGFDWDVGVHYIGDVHDPRTDVAATFAFLTGGAVEWADMGGVVDRIVVGDQIEVALCKGREPFIEEIGAAFPGSADTVVRYLELVRECTRASRAFFAARALPRPIGMLMDRIGARRFHRLAGCTVADVLESLTSDPVLRAVLAGQYGDYGLPPSRASFAIHAMVANHYLEGGAYPVGGASVIPDAITNEITRDGGCVVINAEVRRIVVEQGRVRGVELADGRRIASSTVVSDAGALNTYGRLLAPEHGGRYLQRLLDRGAKRSAAHVCLYLGFDGSSAELGLERPNDWLYPSADYDRDYHRFLEDPDAEFPVVYLSYPSAKDPDFDRRRPGHSTIDVITLANPEWFQPWRHRPWKKRGDDYEALKQRFTDRLMQHVIRRQPQLEGRVRHAELSTPLTTQHFCNWEQGEIYGLDHSPARFRLPLLRPQTPVRGLWLTGQDVCTAGVAGAMFGGVLCASAMLRRDLTGAVRRDAPTT